MLLPEGLPSEEVLDAFEGVMDRLRLAGLPWVLEMKIKEYYWLGPVLYQLEPGYVPPPKPVPIIISEDSDGTE